MYSFLKKKTKFESKLVSLPNPRTNQPARFIIADDNSLFEIQKLYKHPSSWFVDQSVQEGKRTKINKEQK